MQKNETGGEEERRRQNGGGKGGVERKLRAPGTGQLGSFSFLRENGSGTN